jgi:hypothetical protein
MLTALQTKRRRNHLLPPLLISTTLKDGGMPVIPFYCRRLLLPTPVPNPMTPFTPIDRPLVFVPNSAPGKSLSPHNWRHGSLPVAGPTTTAPLFTTVNYCGHSAPTKPQHLRAPLPGGYLFDTRPTPTTPCTTADHRWYSVAPCTPWAPKWWLYQHRLPTPCLWQESLCTFLPIDN